MSSLFKSGNNDGVVTLRSQLSLPAQKASVKTRGVYEDHVLILSSKTTSDTLNDFLERSLKK